MNDNQDGTGFDWEKFYAADAKPETVLPLLRGILETLKKIERNQPHPLDLI